MGLAPAVTTEAHKLNAVGNSRQRKMQSQHFLLVSMIAVFLLATFIPTNAKAQEYGPILMNRRDLLPYGEIVSELKGKTMGGRMRFGKRSGFQFIRSGNAFIPSEVLEAYERQQQL